MAQAVHSYLNSLDAVQTVMVQFSFSNRDLVPPLLCEERPGGVLENVRRKTMSAMGRGGEQFIYGVHNVNAVPLVHDLEAMGYELVYSASVRRLRQGNPKPYWTVRFVFAEAESAEPTIEYLRSRESDRSALLDLLGQALWRVRAFRNPYFGRDGKLYDDRFSLSVNLEARVPLYDNGERRRVWRKNELGQRIGESPVELGPDHDLRIVKGRIELI